MTTRAIDNPNEADIAALAAKRQTAQMRTAVPAIIISFDPDTDSASVQPVLRGKRWNAYDEEITTFRMKSIDNVPVQFPAGQKGGMTPPFSAGDSVLLICAERSIDEWKQIGGVGVDDITPADPRRFDLDDAFVIGGVRGLNDPLPSDAKASDGPVLWSPDFVYLGDSTASDFVALASLVVNELNALWSAMNTHVHAGVTTGPGTSANSGLAGSAGPVAADKVKAT